MGAMGPGGVTYDQDSFQWRADDGGEAAGLATILVDNVDFTNPPLDTNLRLRLLVQHENTGVTNSNDFSLWYSLNGATVKHVNATADVCRSELSPHFAQFDDSTRQMAQRPDSGDTAYAVSPNFGMNETGVFHVGSETDFLGETECEYEWCMQLRSVDLVEGDEVEFFLFRNGGAQPLATYTSVPKFIVVDTGPRCDWLTQETAPDWEGSETAPDWAAPETAPDWAAPETAPDLPRTSSDSW